MSETAMQRAADAQPVLSGPPERVCALCGIEPAAQVKGGPHGRTPIYCATCQDVLRAPRSLVGPPRPCAGGCGLLLEQSRLHQWRTWCPACFKNHRQRRGAARAKQRLREIAVISPRRTGTAIRCCDCGLEFTAKSETHLRCHACSAHRLTERHRGSGYYFDNKKRRVAERMVVQQGRCAICGQARGYMNGRLCVDHVHDGGRPPKLRALLCLQCNAALGHLHEDVRLIGPDSPIGVYLRFWREFYHEGCDPEERRRVWLTTTGPLFDREGQRVDVPPPRLTLLREAG